jgi:hypothetical protein
VRVVDHQDVAGLEAIEQHEVNVLERAADDFIA